MNSKLWSLQPPTPPVDRCSRAKKRMHKRLAEQKERELLGLTEPKIESKQFTKPSKSPHEKTPEEIAESERRFKYLEKLMDSDDFSDDNFEDDFGSNKSRGCDTFAPDFDDDFGVGEYSSSGVNSSRFGNLKNKLFEPKFTRFSSHNADEKESSSSLNKTSVNPWSYKSNFGNQNDEVKESLNAWDYEEWDEVESNTNDTKFGWMEDDDTNDENKGKKMSSLEYFEMLLEEERKKELGDFDDFEDEFLMSDADLKRESEKLREEQKSREQVTGELVDAFDRFIVDLVADGERITDVLIALNHITMGTGKLSLSSDGVYWTGTILTFPRTLKFPYTEMTNIHVKFISEESPQLLFTMCETIFLQFMTKDDENIVTHIEKQLLEKRTLVLRGDGNTEAVRDCIDNENEALVDLEKVSERKLSAILEKLKATQLRLAKEKEEEARLLELKYETQLQKAQEEYLCEVDEIKSMLEEEKKSRICVSVVTAVDTWSECKLCYDNTEDRVMQPCGHRICSKCFERLIAYDMGVCPWDRMKFEITNL
ncbi:hypothetical protein HK098_001996 [Nowakowskiella sp. JEL0407]|nr:hypothetical protein HK098_001996 [Nowakowskiella sp. JEL0407]